MGDEHLASVIVETIDRQTGALDLHKSERTPDQKRAIIAALLERFPSRSTKWLSERAGVSRHLVDRVAESSRVVRSKVVATDGRVIRRAVPVNSGSMDPELPHGYAAALSGPLEPITPQSYSGGGRRSLPEKYMPMRLNDVVGQPEAVGNLQAFVADPYPAAFILFGPTGTGKTASGVALATELGCDLDNLAGGFEQIASGKQDGAAVDDLLRSLRHRPMFGSGWRVALINEADAMTKQAENRWLDGLESLPGKSIVVFTTNSLRSLSDRFCGRCELVEYHGSTAEFRHAMNYRCRQVWHAETGVDDFRPVAGLGMIRDGAGPVSLRVALRQVEGQLRCRATAV